MHMYYKTITYNHYTNYTPIMFLTDIMWSCIYIYIYISLFIPSHIEISNFDSNYIEYIQKVVSF